MSRLDQIFIFMNCQEMVLVEPFGYNGKQTWHRDETSMARSSWEI